ncbi:MAG: SCO family protein [Cyclobacteriaceae bacterium]|nr:SCO family protein [Cyclobacteriaceae bacterium]MCH8515552.1 SCO family protein [Cyclobacteriaceae bacterium]
MLRTTFPLFVFSLIFLTISCDSSRSDADANKEDVLPFLGRKQIIERELNGRIVTDTVPHQIAPFTYINQHGDSVTEANYINKIYVADFFFTSCPTICPIMKDEMLRVHEYFKDDDRLKILSHTIDPEYDDVERLSEFASRLDIDGDKWFFVTGDKSAIYSHAQKSYFATALEDEDEPGGYLHSGAFILVDHNRHIRGIYDGTNSNKVDLMIKDIEKLLKAEEDQLG